jgi:hypothetical protein
MEDDAVFCASSAVMVYDPSGFDRSNVYLYDQELSALRGSVAISAPLAYCPGPYNVRVTLFAPVVQSPEYVTVSPKLTTKLLAVMLTEPPPTTENVTLSEVVLPLSEAIMVYDPEIREYPGFHV